jgi:hypothetical protein
MAPPPALVPPAPPPADVGPLLLQVMVAAATNANAPSAK